MRKEIVVLALLSACISCNVQNEGCAEAEDRNLELESTLLLTQEVYHHYTQYLLNPDIKSKTRYGSLVWKDIARLDSLALKQNGLELDLWRIEDGEGGIQEVQIRSVKYGVSWNIEVDSVLNTLRE